MEIGYPSKSSRQHTDPKSRKQLRAPYGLQHNDKILYLNAVAAENTSKPK